MISCDGGWRRVVALAIVSCRVMLLRGRVAVLVGIVMLMGNLLTSHVPRGLMVLAMTFVGTGALAGPMIAVSDRRDGVLGFLANLPIDRRELALGRLLPIAVATVVGTWLGVLMMWLSLKASGSSVPVTALIPAGALAATFLFWLAAFLTPLFARLSPLVAVAIPVASMLLLMRLLRDSPIGSDGLGVITRLLNRGISETQQTVALLAAWAGMIALGAIVCELIGRAVQRRGAPSPRAIEVLSRHRDGTVDVDARVSIPEESWQ